MKVYKITFVYNLSVIKTTDAQEISYNSLKSSGFCEVCLDHASSMRLGINDNYFLVTWFASVDDESCLSLFKLKEKNCVIRDITCDTKR